MESVKVSIITVCYNSKKYIRQTLESVLNQTYSNIEYIIIDGGSTDGTVDIIKQYESAFNGRMKWVSESDRGIYDAINKGIKMSKGDLIGILSSDDWYETDSIEKVIKLYDKNYPYQVLYGMARTLKDDIEWQIQFVNNNALVEFMMPHEACFITRKAYKKVGLYSLKYKIASDYDLLLRLNENEQMKFVPIYSVLVNFRLGGVSSSEYTIYEHFVVRYHHGQYSGWSFAIYTIWFNIKIGLKKIMHLK